MAIQKVDTEAVASMASAIYSANRNINSAFQVLQRNGNNLGSSWNSGAGSAATTLLYSLFRGNQARSAILDNYVNILQHYVTPDYNSAEIQNTTLASQFL